MAYKIAKNTANFKFRRILYNFGPFWRKNGFPQCREVFKKLRGGGGFVLTKYEPVASHGDHIHGRFRR